MRRADRLFELVGYLRAGEPVTADALARRLEVSVPAATAPHGANFAPKALVGGASRW